MQRRLLIFILLITAAGILAGCVSVPASPGEQTPEQTDDPFSSGRWRGKKIAVLGDSITELGGFQPHLERLLGAEILSYGISGTTISGSFDMAFANRVTKIDKSVDLIVVFGGTNDFGADLALGDRDSTRITFTTFYGALRLLCKRLKEKYPDAQYVFLTPTQRTVPSLSGSGDVNAQGATLEDYAEAIKFVCAEADIPVLDLYHQSAITQKTAAQYLYDGLHPNAAGFEVLGEEIATFLAKMD
ncbi:MAG: SGNH/GDSL hydrolase family protein [Clostridia bacterium]|nr:SGNH/GDSL hydrolase family protein [Clostridia bacterium]